MYVNNSWLLLDPIIYHCFTHTNSRTISRTLMDFKMADTSERRVICNTILLKYHGTNHECRIFFLLFSYFKQMIITSISQKPDNSLIFMFFQFSVFSSLSVNLLVCLSVFRIEALSLSSLNLSVLHSLLGVTVFQYFGISLKLLGQKTKSFIRKI